MKKLFTILVAVLLTANVFLPQQASAQSPEKMSYQAVIRDASDNLVTNQLVGMHISILQNSVGGTSVYSEIQTPTTNDNGLVSIEIGGGTGFDTINWANGPYYIKTETDPTGGTSYTITGTSQLLSVPYALHAKTADTVTNGITENDPTYTSSQAANITAIDITNLGNLSGVNTGDQNLSTLATKTALTDSIALLRSELPNITTYTIGDFAQGGVVFWVDETGLHGLACAIDDQDGGSGIQWYNGTFTNTQAFGDGVYAGEMNTILIIIDQGINLSDYAAGVCANYSITQNSVIYGDWYLPSKYELNLMYLNAGTINTTATANSGTALSNLYWSSTESSNNNAAYQVFSNGDQANTIKSGTTVKVRAVRAF